MAKAQRRVLTARYLRPTLVLAGALAFAFAAAPNAAAQPKGAAASPEANGRKALDLFKKGQALYKAGKFADALPLLRESFALVASPNSRILIARCLAGTSDHLAAYNEFDAVIADVDARTDDKYKDTRVAAVQERDDLAAAKLAMVTISVANATADTRVTVRGQDVAASNWGKPMPMEPGPAEITLTAPPAQPRTQSVDLALGSKKTIALDTVIAGIPPVSSASASPGGSRAVLRPVAYLAGGIGVVGFGLFGVFGGLATATYSDLESKCAAGGTKRSCPSDAKGQIDDGKLQKDVANAGLIVGSVGIAAGVTLFILSMDRGPKKEAAPAVQPVAGPGYLGVQGSF